MKIIKSNKIPNLVNVSKHCFLGIDSKDRKSFASQTSAGKFQLITFMDNCPNRVNGQIYNSCTEIAEKFYGEADEIIVFEDRVELLNWLLED